MRLAEVLRPTAPSSRLDEPRLPIKQRAVAHVEFPLERDVGGFSEAKHLGDEFADGGTHWFAQFFCERHHLPARMTPR